MTTLTAGRTWTLPGLALVAFGAFVAARAASPEMFKAPVPWDPRFREGLELPAALGFYETRLAPRLSADLRGYDAFVGARFGNPASNPWASDPAAVELVEKRTLRSVANALKGYAAEQLGFDRWSLPVMGRGGAAALGGESRGVRFRLGFSHLAPRADLLVPVGAGRLALSVDARGRLGTTFCPASSRLRLAGGVDVPARTATVSLRAQF